MLTIWQIILLWICLLNINTGWSLPITGPELIQPNVSEISLCVPETMREPIHSTIMQLPKVALVTAKLYKITKGSFAKKCQKLSEQLAELDSSELLDQQNISPKLRKQDRQTFSAILSDADTGFENYLYILTNLNSHFTGYVAVLHGMLKQNTGLTVIDLIHSVDLIQRGLLELQEILQLLSLLSLAYKEINDYQAILLDLKYQFLTITYLVNTISTLTEDLRVSYLSLLDKGDCSNDQIVRALGITQKKIMAIEEDE